MEMRQKSLLAKDGSWRDNHVPYEPNEYAKDRRWSDQFIPKICEIVGPYLLVTTAPDIDMTQGADLIVLKARDMRVAARVRRPGFQDSYGYDFTIRSDRPTGARTEYEKIVNGFGDWMFYGHAIADDIPDISRWMILDLHVLRAVRENDELRKKVRGGEKVNRDGTKFRWYDIRSFPRTIFIAHSDHFDF